MGRKINIPEQTLRRWYRRWKNEGWLIQDIANCSIYTYPTIRRNLINYDKRQLLKARPQENPTDTNKPK